MQSSQSSKTVIRGTGVTAGLTLASRVLGFIRDLLVARLFGSGLVADAFFVAYRIPNLLRSFVAEGALTSAFVPVFSSELAKGPEAARQAIREVSGFILVVTTLLTLLGIIFSDQIIHLIAPGFQLNPEKGALCSELTAVMFPYIMCVSLIALVSGALNAVHIYGASGLAQVVMNLVLIAGAVIAGFYPDREAAMALAISVLVGGVAQIVAQIPTLRRAGFSIFPAAKIFTPVTREVVRLMLPATVGAGIYQTGIFLNTLFASFLAAGSVSWLFYADRVTQLPIGIFTIALAQVLLPVLSRARASNNEKEFSLSLINSLRYTSFVIIPVVMFLYLFAEPVVTLLFQRGAFDATDSVRTAAAVQGLLLGIWAVSCHSMVTRAFIARKDTVTPTLLGACMLVLNAWISLTLMGPVVAESPGKIDEIVSAVQGTVTIPFFRQTLGHVGLTLGSSLSSTITFLVLATVALRRFTEMDARPFIYGTFKAFFAGLVMTTVLYFSGLTAPGNQKDALMHLVEAMLLAPALYCGASFIVKSAEVQETISIILRLLNRVLGR